MRDTLWHALTDPNMRRASWVSIFVAFFNQWSGIGIVSVYCIAIFEDIHKLGAPSRLNEKQESQCIGLSCLIGSILSYFTVGLFSRRAIFMGGHFFMGIFLFIIGYLIRIRQAESALLFICLFILAFQTTQGSAFWIYVAEIINSDSVMGACLFCCMLNLTVQSMTTTYILSSKVGVDGLFYLLGSV